MHVPRHLDLRAMPPAACARLATVTPPRAVLPRPYTYYALTARGEQLAREAAPPVLGQHGQVGEVRAQL